MACLFKHQWKGCTCEKCGKTRDEGHAFRPLEDACHRRCDVCGVEVESHDWNAEGVCGRCGAENRLLLQPAIIYVRRVQESAAGVDSPCTVMINGEQAARLSGRGADTVAVMTKQSVNLVTVKEFPKGKREFCVKDGEMVLAELLFQGFNGLKIVLKHHLTPDQADGLGVKGSEKLLETESCSGGAGFFPGDALGNTLGKLEASCLKCGALIQFERGAREAQKKGITDQVIACSACGAVFETMLAPNKMTLTAEVTERYR